MKILSTKVAIPPLRSQSIPRARLFELLNKGVECGFLLVSAPAGYGKTTLVNSWLRKSDRQCIWISLDEKDNDLFRFFSYLTASIRNANIKTDGILESVLQPQQQTDIEAILTPLVNEVAQLDRPITLVLDDYHLIQNPLIHQAVGFLVKQHPPSLLLVIVTRADPPLQLAKFRARGEMAEIRQADLCFTIDEAAEFLKTTLGLQLNAEEARDLTERTEGWIAGLQMAGLSLVNRNDPAEFIQSFSGEDHFILDFLFEEVFQRQPPEIQIFLLQTSILKQMSEPLCNAVTQRKDSQEVLQTLEINNLFVIRLDDKRKWFRYHHLFNDLLQDRLRKLHPETQKELHLRACSWYMDQDDLESAIDHALAGQDFESAAGLIEQVIQQEEVLNKLVAIKTWLDLLPYDVIKSHPWLAVYQGWVDFETGTREGTERNLDTLEQSLDATFKPKDPQKTHILGHISALRAYAAFYKKDIDRALELGQKALLLMPENDRMRSSAAVSLGAAYWASGDVIRTEQAFSVAREAGLRISEIRAAPATTYMGIQLVKQGKLWQAVETFIDALHLATLPNGIETPLAGFARIKLGDIFREQNQLALAAEHLTRGMELCRKLGQIDIIVDACICLGRYQLLLGDLENTQETIQFADRICQKFIVDFWLLCWLDDLRIKAWLAANNLEAAITWAKTSGLSAKGPFSYQHDLHHQNLARVWVAENTFSNSEKTFLQAETLLEKLRLAAAQAGWAHEQIILLILQAVNYQALNHREQALERLLQAVLLAEPGGYFRVFVDEGEKMQPLLSNLADVLQNPQKLEKIAPDFPKEKSSHLKEYISKLMTAFKGKPDLRVSQDFHADRGKISAPVALLSEELSPREMDVLRLLAQGQSDKQIATELVIALETVHKHLKNIYGKLDVHSRAKAVIRAQELKIL